MEFWRRAYHFWKNEYNGEADPEAYAAREHALNAINREECRIQRLRTAMNGRSA